MADLPRRKFLTGLAGILASGIAPAVLPSGVIMPVRRLWVPSPLDGIGDCIAESNYDFGAYDFTVEMWSSNEGIEAMRFTKGVARYPLGQFPEGVNLIQRHKGHLVRVAPRGI